MTHALEGRRYWEVGNHAHIWVVDAVVSDEKGREPFAILISEDGLNTKDVELSHLENRNLYTPAT